MKHVKIKASQLLPFIMLAILLIIGAVLSNRFFTLANFSNIIQYAAEYAMLAIGMTFVLLIGGIDLSVGSLMAFSSVVCASMALNHVNMGLIFVVAIVIGFAAGLANGLLVTKGNIEPFMATLAMMLIMRACTYLYTGGGPLTGSVDLAFRNIIKGDLLGIRFGIYYVIIAFLIAYTVLSSTRFGRHVYAVGGNQETAGLFGVRVTRVKNLVYIISGILAALAGLFLAARIGIGEPRSGYGYEVDAITMCVIGGVSMTGGKGSIIGTFIGLLIVSMVKNIMNILGIDTNAQPIITGVIILISTLIITRESLGQQKSLTKNI